MDDMVRSMLQQQFYHMLNYLDVKQVQDPWNRFTFVGGFSFIKFE
jgi:hypothetical protein